MSSQGGRRDQKGDQAPWVGKRPGDTKKGETYCEAEASSPPGLPWFREAPAVEPDLGVEQSYLGPPPKLIQESPWLSLPSRRNSGSSKGRLHPPRPRPRPPLPTLQPGRFTCPAQMHHLPATLRASPSPHHRPGESRVSHQVPVPPHLPLPLPSCAPITSCAPTYNCDHPHGML